MAISRYTLARREAVSGFQLPYTISGVTATPSDIMQYNIVLYVGVHRWAEGFMSWNHSCRLRHVTSGRYLAATADNQVVTFHRNAATEEATAFFVRENKVSNRYTLARGEPVSGFELPCLFPA